MAPFTLAYLIVPGTCILTHVDIVPERENILRKGCVLLEGGNSREHNKVEEPIAELSMDLHESPFRHIPTTNVTAMMIQ